jgi:mRNA-degrading endonuclease RelE of RelBE toxin-antitoxin system
MDAAKGTRKTFKVRQSQECSAAIDKLDPDTRAFMQSDLQEFTSRFRSSSTDEELVRSRFTYKPLLGRGCREVKLNQIYVVQGKYRVTVTVLVHDKTVWFVNCFKKRGSDQKQGIDRAVRIAREIRKDTQ